MSEFLLHHGRVSRIGVSDAVCCAGNSVAQLAAILDAAAGKRCC